MFFAFCFCIFLVFAAVSEFGVAFLSLGRARTGQNAKQMQACKQRLAKMEEKCQKDAKVGGASHRNSLEGWPLPEAFAFFIYLHFIFWPCFAFWPASVARLATFLHVGRQRFPGLQVFCILVGRGFQVCIFCSWPVLAGTSQKMQKDTLNSDSSKRKKYAKATCQEHTIPENAVQKSARQKMQHQNAKIAQ